MLLAIQNGTDTAVNRVSMILDLPGEMKVNLYVYLRWLSSLFPCFQESTDITQASITGYPEAKIYELDNTINFSSIEARSTAYVTVTMKLETLPQVMPIDLT